LLIGRRRKFLVSAVVVIAIAAALSGVYLSGVLGNGGSVNVPGCSKPAGGYLIVASETGFNDSVGHGAPTKNWPIITVHQGQLVTIVVCNEDKTQAHGFQIDHYHDSSIQTIVPGQVIVVQFVASEAGTFRIYCDIFCSIHIFMQSGQLIVQP